MSSNAYKMVKFKILSLRCYTWNNEPLWQKTNLLLIDVRIGNFLPNVSVHGLIVLPSPHLQ